MSMRILTPRGRVVNVIKVIPYAEVQSEINGDKRNRAEAASDLSVNPTGLKIFLKREIEAFAATSIYVGNLPTEKVKEVISSLLTDEYYDLSQFKYQDIKIDNSVLMFENLDITVDGGKSNPYFIETTDVTSMVDNVCLPNEFNNVAN